MKKESTKPSRQPGKSTLLLEQALIAADLAQIIAHFKKLSDEEARAKWKGLPLEAKEKVLAAARDSHGKKATEQRVALAHAIAVADADAATDLLQHALADKAQARQSISKVWFVESRGWIGLGALKMGEADGILHALIDVASNPSLFAEMKNKTKGGYASAERKLYDFSRWAMPALAHLPNNESDKQAKVQRLIALSKDWPEEWRNEMKRLADAASTPLTNEREKQSPAPDAIIAWETENQAPAPEAVTVETALAEAPKEPADDNHSQLVQHPAPTSTPEPQRVPQAFEEDMLINQARLLIGLREEEIAQKQAEAATLTRLVTTLLTTREENARLKRQLSNAEERFTELQNSNAQLEASLTRAERLRQEAEMIAARLGEEAELLKKELGAEKAARADEQRWTAEQIERETKYELNGFKERLAAKLAPVFIQKRHTDLQPTDAELAEFLRRWFQDVEDKLQEQGISLRKD